MSDHLKEVREKFFKLFGKEACSFQPHAINASLNGSDVIVVAPTGSGKTLPLIAPILYQDNGMTIIISALTNISRQIAEILASFKVNFVSLHGSHLTPEEKQSLLDNSLRAIIMPIEMFTSSDFGSVLRDRLFQARVSHVCVDEAHVIILWARFRSKYRNIVWVCRQLPHVKWYFTSATLTDIHVKYLQDFLLLEDHDTVVIRLSNDRPNVRLITREMKHPMSSFKDALVFLGPNPTPTNRPGPAIIYCNTKADTEALGTFLQGALNAYGPGMEDCVSWYHATSSEEHGKMVVGRLQSGKYWILTCTEIMGMGVDVSKIPLIGQWGRPQSMQALVQRSGRAGRNSDEPATFIALYQKTKASASGSPSDPIILKEEHAEGITSIPHSQTPLASVPDSIPSPGSSSLPAPSLSIPQGPQASSTSGNKKTRKRTGTSFKKWKQTQDIGSLEAAGFTEEKDDEDVLAFFNGTGCIRLRLNKYFGNNKADTFVCSCARCTVSALASVQCCSDCNPLLLDIFDGILWIKSKSTKRKIKVAEDATTTEDEEMALWTLSSWSEEKVRETIGGFFGGGAMILSDELTICLIKLAKLHVLKSWTDILEQTDWTFAARWGEEVLKILHSFFPLNQEEIAPSNPIVRPPKPGKAKATVLNTTQNANAPEPRKYQCSNCDVFGHTKPTCPQPKTLCPKCGEIGHSGRACKAKKKGKPAKDLPSITQSEVATGVTKGKENKLTA